MRERHEDRMPPPAAATGGYEFEIVELSPNLYFRPSIPIKSTGSLVPVDENSGVASREAPLPYSDHAAESVEIVPEKFRSKALSLLLRRLKVATVGNAELEFDTLFYVGLTLYDARSFAECVCVLEGSLNAAISLETLSQLQSALALLNNAYRGQKTAHRGMSMYENLLKSVAEHANPLVHMTVLYKYSELLAMLGLADKSQLILHAARNVMDVSKD